MEQVVRSVLLHDGMVCRKVIADNANIRWWHYVPKAVRDRATFDDGHDEALGIYTLELTWPVYGMWDVANYGPKKFRRLMMVNMVYAARVSDCIEMARVEFFSRSHFAPGFAFVRDLPAGAENGMDVHGLVLCAAEWMPGQCVAVGGR
jgi:hypothetical protein